MAPADWPLSNTSEELLRPKLDWSSDRRMGVGGRGRRGEEGRVGTNDGNVADRRMRAEKGEDI